MFEKIEPELSTTKSSTFSSFKMEELSGVTLVLLIGGGVLAVIICFIVAKRCRSCGSRCEDRRGPHVAVGHDARKSSIRKGDLKGASTRFKKSRTRTCSPYYYRMKAVDDVKELEKEIAKQDGTTRHPRDSRRRRSCWFRWLHR
ncbi:hypothetical protein pipiens_015436 [Culex pipiens pipiens]|uniref:Uncharacterized protein n=1 Tax=Culex pipiens pipiens TaxID=38569 RepID=A0ABD1CSA9_CULPP